MGSNKSNIDCDSLKGDNGNLDKDGYLFLSGRSKEVINRGGEIISPFEIEEVCCVLCCVGCL